jgi:nucleoside phosphorylase
MLVRSGSSKRRATSAIITRAERCDLGRYLTAPSLFHMEASFMISFFSSESDARIEPDHFIAHVMAARGLTPHDLDIRHTVVLTLIPELERRLLNTLGNPQPNPHPIQRQTWYNPEACAFSVMTSPMGAPIAVMLLEQLIALGARQFIYLGFCGALNPTYRIGDCFVPTTGIREEGTSYHYLPAGVVPAASALLKTLVMNEAATREVSVQSGPIWTTDALYRETAQKIQRFQADGVHAVDMEMAALFAVAQYRACEVGAILIVSDECYHPTWQPGFHAPHFRQGCRDAVALSIAAANRAARQLEQAI